MNLEKLCIDNLPTEAKESYKNMLSGVEKFNQFKLQKMCYSYFKCNGNIYLHVDIYTKKIKKFDVVCKIIDNNNINIFIEEDPNKNLIIRFNHNFTDIKIHGQATSTFINYLWKGQTLNDVKREVIETIKHSDNFYYEFLEDMLLIKNRDFSWFWLLVNIKELKNRLHQISNLPCVF